MEHAATLVDGLNAGFARLHSMQELDQCHEVAKEPELSDEVSKDSGAKVTCQICEMVVEFSRW